MTTIPIKPLSINESRKGRTFKTDAYKKFERDCLFLLPKNVVVPSGKLQINHVFGFSTSNQDVDSPSKLCTDILQKKYGFNDNKVYYMTLTKVVVPKGQEFWSFEILPYTI